MAQKQAELAKKENAEPKKRRQTITIPNATLYKSGSVQALQGNSCRLFLNYNDPATGKRKNKNKTYRATDKEKLSRKDAVAALQAWAAELEAGLQKEQEPTKPTVAEYVSAYIKARSKIIERRTASSYNALLRKFIEPGLGDYRLDELTPEIVEAWVNTCAEEYAPRSVRKALVLLRSAMTQAVERDVIPKNPTRTVAAPKVPNTDPATLDEEECIRLVRHIALELDRPAYMGYALALLMGMRQGEICALRWRNVDLDNHTLFIREALGHDNEAKGANHWYLKEPKTDRSKRPLEIPEQLIEPLKKLQAKAKEDAMAAGKRSKWKDYFVIGLADGSYMNGDMLTHRWRKTRDELNLKCTNGQPPRFHDLRHTYATIAVTGGTDIKTVSAILGHSNAAMTLNIYAGAVPKAIQSAMQETANTMFAEAAKPTGEIVELAKTGTED